MIRIRGVKPLSESQRGMTNGGFLSGLPTVPRSRVLINIPARIQNAQKIWNDLNRITKKKFDNDTSDDRTRAKNFELLFD